MRVGAHMIEMPMRVDHDAHRLVGALGDLGLQPGHRRLILGVDQQNAIGPVDMPTLSPMIPQLML